MSVAPRNPAVVNRRRPRATLGGVALAAVLALAACGTTDSVDPGAGPTASGTAAATPSATDTEGPASSAAATAATATSSSSGPATSAAAIPGVPARITSAGTIKVGSEVAYPPMEFLAADGKTPQGFDIDLFTAVAGKLGVRAQFENTKFDSILIGVQSGRYDVGLSAFTITKERLAAVNMVSYLSVGTQWATKKGNAAGVSPDAACGKRVAVQTATTQQKDVQARSTACQKAGKPAIDILSEPDGQVPFNDVLTGKADAALSDLVVVADVLRKTGGQLETVGQSYGTAPFGFAVAKKDTAFAQALATATGQLIADGTYAQLATKWNVENAKVARSEVNPAVTD